MESMPDHSWRRYEETGEHHQVAGLPESDAGGVVWAACGGGGPADLWATEPDPDSTPRCAGCLVLVGEQAADRRERRIADTGSQTRGAFLALSVDGPTVPADSVRLDRPDLRP
jgi:hypothetical protein